MSNTPIKNYGVICAEDLNVKNMIKNRYLAKSINDVSWSDFLQKLSFKAESAGRQVVRVNPRNTSQLCSKCDKKVRKSLSVRTHKCSHCGLVLDRDVNAARNILFRGIGQGLSEFKPAGDKNLCRKVSFVNETGNYNLGCGSSHGMPFYTRT